MPIYPNRRAAIAIGQFSLIQEGSGLPYVQYTGQQDVNTATNVSAFADQGGGFVQLPPIQQPPGCPPCPAPGACNCPACPAPAPCNCAQPAPPMYAAPPGYDGPEARESPPALPPGWTGGAGPMVQPTTMTPPTPRPTTPPANGTGKTVLWGVLIFLGFQALRK